MKRLLLIHPAPRSLSVGFGQTEGWGLPPLSLAYVAALTPPSWDVKIVDECVEILDFDEPFDLVGITAYTANAPRAYEISKRYRSKGVTVVLGGIHATMLPDEALQHVDAVVLGEAEPVWGQVISDHERGALARRYEAPRQPLIRLPIPRRDLLSRRYKLEAIQTTRGCPFRCEFCAVTAFNGSDYRQRPVEDVLDELETIEGPVVYFIDDNFFGTKQHRERSIALCRGMLERGIKKTWVTQATLNVAQDEEVMKHARDAGCIGVLVGIESIQRETLKAMKKAANLQFGADGMAEAIRNLHRYGIGVCAAFIFGHDHDDLGVFEDTLKYVRETGIDAVNPSLLTPYPGTALFERLQREGRLIYRSYPEDWERFDENNVTFIPKRMSVTDLVRGFDYLTRESCSGPAIFRHAARSLYMSRSVPATMLGYQLNAGNRKMFDHDSRFRHARAPESRPAPLIERARAALDRAASRLGSLGARAK